MLLLQIQRAGQRDVAVKMPFVKFVENQRRNAAQFRVVNHLPQQNAFGHKPDFRPRRRDIFEADLITDLAPSLTPSSCATRAASSRAASRRGWRTTTWPLPSNPCFSSICGTCVDLPEPVGADKISRRSDFNRAMMSRSMS